MLQWCSAKQFLKIWHQEKQRWNLLKDNYPVLKKLYCELAKLPCFAVCSCIDRLGRNKGVADWPHTNRLLTDLIFKVLILTENKSDGLCRSIAVKTSVICFFFFFFVFFSSLFPALATLLCHLLWELILPAIKDQFASLDSSFISAYPNPHELVLLKWVSRRMKHDPVFCRVFGAAVTLCGFHGKGQRNMAQRERINALPLCLWYKWNRSQLVYRCKLHPGTPCLDSSHV